MLVRLQTESGPRFWFIVDCVMLEHTYHCPYCGEMCTEAVEPVAGRQEYVVDCWVCCRPIRIRVRVQRGQVVMFTAQPSSGHR